MSGSVGVRQRSDEAALGNSSSSNGFGTLEATESDGGLGEPVRSNQTTQSNDHPSLHDLRWRLELSEGRLDNSPVGRLNPPIELRLLDYVSPYDENLMCPICRCPFINPVMMADCGHCFCSECIHEWNARPTCTTLGDCPACRTPARLVPSTPTSRILANIVGDLLVKCPNHMHGCATVAKRADIHDHVATNCDYGLVECATEGCIKPVRRKDSSFSCLHHPVSCAVCRTELQLWELEMHWEGQCPDREATCGSCGVQVASRRLDEHLRTSCPLSTVTCPGELFGCAFRDHRKSLDAHMHDCVLARLAPAWKIQQERLNQQDIAQKHLMRKVAILENGFTAFRRLLQPARPRHRYDSGAREAPFGELSASRLEDHSSPSPSGTADLRATRSLALPNSTSDEVPDPIDPAFPPYASPLHHLLSMHEALREELSHISAALSDLDARHSMQALNDNLRTREELAYLGAQVGSLQRHVHWLTSAELQQQQRGAGRGNGARVAPVASSSSTTNSTPGAIGAMSSSLSPVSGTARIVGAEQVPRSTIRRNSMRRGTSEEGRTKL